MEKTFQTSNLSLAAALLASGKAKFVKTIQTNIYKSEFVFFPKDVCEKLQAEYINGDLTLPVRAVEDNIKMLKSLAKGGSQNGY